MPRTLWIALALVLAACAPPPVERAPADGRSRVSPESPKGEVPPELDAARRRLLATPRGVPPRLRALGGQEGEPREPGAPDFGTGVDDRDPASPPPPAEQETADTGGAGE